ncbi:hypothetical protein [uncultured Nostoc sp.]|uniref:hypothetical protein n=1 Tax=uncultured Nostoc sp. TaxID=340711 RepID=UPI00260BA1A3|nr:hypothetical protein [uncultured Nostoc sp.]
MSRYPKVAQDTEQAIACGNPFGVRKRKRFKLEHIRKAWQCLHEQNWLNIKEQITS